jgi:hypothetical protein
MAIKQLTHVPVVREWCQSLGVLTAVSISRQEADTKLAAYVPMLLSDFTDEAFTTDSLSHVAKACKRGFPTYPELHMALREWWQAHKPQPLRLAVDGSDIQAEQRERQREIRESWADPDAVLRSVENCAGNRLLLRTLASAVNLYAPQHRHLVPIDDVATEAPDSAPEREPVKPHYLTPAQLDRISPLPGGRKREDHARCTSRSEKCSSAR